MNSDTVNYRAVMTVTKIHPRHDDKWYDDNYDFYVKNYPNNASYAQGMRDQQREDHATVGQVVTFTFGDHRKPATVKAQMTKAMYGMDHYRIDAVEWFISETTWKPVDV